MNGLATLLSLLACVFVATANENVDADNYIIGGRKATPGQFPQLVSMRTIQNEHFCGGFILSDRWVCTAAHCTVGARARPANILVATGAHTRTDGQRYRVARVVNHPRYDRHQRTFDVSIVQTKIRIVLNARVAVIRWPTGPVVHNGQTMLIAGWGITKVIIIILLR